MITVAINGAGRIGRAIARLLLTNKNIKLIAINDLADAKTIKYLLKYDSIHGVASDLELESIKFSSYTTPSECNFGKVDIVVEATGKFTNSASCQAFIDSGAGAVVITASTNDNTETIRSSYTINSQIVSVGSCTTNALDLIVSTLDKEFGVEAVLATSIHSYTSDQNLLDSKHSFELRRARSATQNIIPVSTGAARNFIKLDQRFAGKAAAIGLRVPTPNGSVMQVTVKLKTKATADVINKTYEKQSSILPPNLLTISYKHKCLADIIGASYSAIVDGNLTLVQDDLVSITAWHDNEFGYASKVVTLIENYTKETHATTHN